jgi:hypothetical protein
MLLSMSAIVFEESIGLAAAIEHMFELFASPVLALINEQSRDSLEQMFEKALRLAYV